jgi:hypothetical protein
MSRVLVTGGSRHPGTRPIAALLRNECPMRATVEGRSLTGSRR